MSIRIWLVKLIFTNYLFLKHCCWEETWSHGAVGQCFPAVVCFCVELRLQDQLQHASSDGDAAKENTAVGPTTDYKARKHYIFLPYLESHNRFCYMEEEKHTDWQEAKVYFFFLDFSLFSNPTESMHWSNKLNQYDCKQRRMFPESVPFTASQL